MADTGIGSIPIVGNGIANTTAANGIKSGTNPGTGFSRQYNASQLQNLWETPWAILPDVFKGINTTGSGYQALRDIGADPLTLYNLMAGRNNSLSGEEGGNAAGNYGNWLAQLYGSMGTAGGRGFNGAELLGNLFNPVGGEGKQTQSALYNILTAGDASTQMRTLFNMAREASNVGMNPLAARGYQAALARTGDTAINRMMHDDANEGANNMPLYQLIRQLAPGLVPG